MLWPVPIRHYLDAMHAQGIERADVLAGTGIDAAALEDSRYRVTLAQYRALLENMARCGAERGLGLDIGLGLTLPNLGPLGYAAMACDTPRQSMEEFWSRHGAMLGVLGHPVFVAEDEQTATFEIATPALSAAAYRFCVEEALCLMVNVGRAVARRKAALARIEFAYPPPPYHERYRQLFACRLVFNAEHTRVTLKRDWIERALSSQDRELTDFYQQHLQKLRRQVEAGASVATQVRDRLLRHAAGLLPSLALMARELGLSERTLCRRLQQEGFNYRLLVEEFRCRQATSLVRASAASAEEISRRLGFRDVNAFRRAFKKWTGQTLRAYARNGKAA